VASHKSALKRMRQNKKRRVINKNIVQKTRTLSKKAVKTLETGNVDESKGAMTQAIRSLDKAVSKGVLKRKTASRKISRLNKRLNSTKK